MEKEDILQLSKSHAYFYQVQTQTGFHWCDFFIWSSTGEPFLQRINYDAVFMGKALLIAKAFYFRKFLPAVAQYFIVQPSCFGNTTGIGSNTTGDGSNTTGDGSISHGTDLEKVADSEDLELVAVFSKPSTCLQSLQILLDHLMLKRHSVNGDGSCLYHAVAHQAGLITAFSTGDEVVSRHLRRLVLLSMLNYPAVRLEAIMSQEEWLQKQKETVTLTGEEI